MRKKIDGIDVLELLQSRDAPTIEGAIQTVVTCPS
jgi:hypothetical protein